MTPAMNSLVVVPTYNEVDNLAAIVESILEHAPETHILIVDDNSPDGTGALADKLNQARPEQVFVLHRARKDGLGQAYVEGFRFALDRGYDVIVQMDADFSHDPKYLPAFFEAIATSASRRQHLYPVVVSAIGIPVMSRT